ncbi:hypothetical protein DFH11DRAFT_1742346 [Phellopilus nigrolimitatus]|nr:hypothetical protein DFH11DRAFT_1742346 [Phellopilus nigrolimitatus]
MPIPELLVDAANATPPNFDLLNASIQLRQNAMRDFANSMQQADATIQQQIPLIKNMAAIQNMQKDQTAFHQILAEMKRMNEKIDDLKTDVKGLTGTVDGLKTDVNGLKADVNGLKTDVNGLKTDVNGLKTDVNGLKEGQKSTTTELKALSLEQSYTIPRLHNSKRVQEFIRLPPPKDADGSDKPWPENNPFPTSLLGFADLTHADVVEWLQFYNQFVDRDSSAPQLRSKFARFIGLTEDSIFVNGDGGRGASGYGGGRRDRQSASEENEDDELTLARKRKGRQPAAQSRKKSRTAAAAEAQQEVPEREPGPSRPRAGARQSVRRTGTNA